jgi:hypothetical protein
LTTTYTVAEHVRKYFKATPVKVVLVNEPILSKGKKPMEIGLLELTTADNMM